jgi:NAD(P)-dependent dehydrogenase (short-subunit alcohol dehydrogenase family)
MVNGKVAVVTGAGSGIGRAVALELVRRGAKVAISDVDLEGLDATERLVAAAGGEAHASRLDVGDRAAVDAYATAVAEHFGVVHQVYNNAGVAWARPILETSVEEFERVLRINLWGVIHGTLAFLPHLVASGDGHVVNVSSLNGYFAQPRMAHYCTSKFAVRGFTESVRADMVEGGLPVRVSVVHPGGVRTNIANSAMDVAKDLGLPIDEADEKRRRAYNEKLLKMDPAQAARIIVDGVERNRPRILVGNDARAVDLLVRLVPTQAARLAAAFEKRVIR